MFNSEGFSDRGYPTHWAIISAHWKVIHLAGKIAIIERGGAGWHIGRSRREQQGTPEILCSGEKTVSKHRENIFKKLKTRNTAQLLKYVYDINLVD